MADTIRTLAALQALLADNSAGDIGAQDLRDMLVSAYPNWQSFATTWTAASGGADIGDGSITSRYIQFGTGTGTLVIASYYLNPGSTTNFGTGEWSFTLPITCTAVRQAYAGSAWAYDSGTAWYGGTVEVATTTTVKISSDGDNTRWGSGAPFTWADADSGGWFIQYEAA